MYEAAFPSWDEHAVKCHAVNCLTSRLDIRDIKVCLNDNCHKFCYSYDSHIDLLSTTRNVEIIQSESDTTIALKCTCNEAFTEDCIRVNLDLLCKLVMIIIDGTYPLLDSEFAGSLEKRKYCSEVVKLCLEKTFSDENFLLNLRKYRDCTASLHCSELREVKVRGYDIVKFKLGFIAVMTRTASD